MGRCAWLAEFHEQMMTSSPMTIPNDMQTFAEKVLYDSRQRPPGGGAVLLATEMIDRLADEWNAAVGDRISAALVNEEDKRIALSFAELVHHTQDAFDRPDLADLAVAAVSRIIMCLSILFCARLLALPLAGGAGHPWIFQAGIVLFLAASAFFIRTDLVALRKTSAERRSYAIREWDRAQALQFQSAVGSLENRLGRRVRVISSETFNQKAA